MSEFFEISLISRFPSIDNNYVILLKKLASDRFAKKKNCMKFRGLRIILKNLKLNDDHSNCTIVIIKLIRNILLINLKFN